MPKLNLGRVVGRDGGFGNTDTVYINDGGAPSVTVEASGEDTAKDFVFTFKNLVRDVATADEVEQIAVGEIVQSSNVITAGVMSSIWAKIKGAFATKSHTHDASDITAGELAAILIANGLIDTDMLAAGAVTTTKIADGAVTKDKLEKTLGDSLSRLGFLGMWSMSDFPMNKPADWGIVIGRLLDAPADSYFVAIDNRGNLYGGSATSGATSVTWVKK